MTRILALWLCVGCAHSQPVRGTPALPVPERTPTSEVFAEAGSAATCEAIDEEVTIAPFIAPIGGTAFRRSAFAAAETLRCCDPVALLEAQRLSIDFVPESQALARAQLSSADPPLEPAVATCIQAHLAQWTMRPAARSDVLRHRMSPFGPRYASSVGTVRVALPAFRPTSP